LPNLRQPPLGRPFGPSYAFPDETEQPLPQQPEEQPVDIDIDTPLIEQEPQGGYLQGVGPTIAEGRSTSKADADNYYNQGVNKYGADAVNDFLQRNPNDYARMMEALQSSSGPQDTSPSPRQSNGGGNGGGGNSRSSDPNAIMQQMMKMWSGGFNQDLVNQRVNSASDTLNRFQKSRMSANNAALANRGLIGSGPQASAMNRTETDIADMFRQEVGDIYGDESQRTDARMMEALGMAGDYDLGLQGAQLGRDRLSLDDRLGSGTLDLQRMLGMGNLDLGRQRLGLDETLGVGRLGIDNMNAENNYNLGLGRLGIDQAELEDAIASGSEERMIEILKIMMAGTNQASNGYNR
jgi:hypothetical protein